MPHKANEARSAYAREYYQKNKERMDAASGEAYRRWKDKPECKVVTRERNIRQRARPEAKARKKEYAREYRLRNLERFLEMERASRKRVRDADPAGTSQKRRAKHLAKKYGLTPEQYNAMHAAQGGNCKICIGPPSYKGLVVDHCHSTGAVRGLLCFRCNRSLGQFEDSPELLRRAADYVEANK